MVVYPNAKINIGLRVLEKRPDGFHNLETVFYPVNAVDVLEVIEAPETKMFQYGIEYPGAPEENLCMRAYRLLEKEFCLPPVEIQLYKQVPVGAGLGGGSSDAAFTLKALNTLFRLQLPDAVLADYAASLGSDCAFFIYDIPMSGSGRGEVLNPVGVDFLRDYEIRLVYPPVFVSTADAYRGIVPRNVRRERGEILEDTPLVDLLRLPVEQWKGRVENDFETTVFAKYPQLESYKQQLYDQGALYASMSGSGSAMFGIFERTGACPPYKK